MNKIFDILEIRKNSENIAIKTEIISISYKELYISVKQLSRFLLKIPNIKNSTIGLYIEPSIEFSIAFFGVSITEATIVPLNINLKKEELLGIIFKGKIQTIITNINYKDNLLKLLKDIKINIIIINSETIIKQNIVPVMQFSELEDVALILQTSGSMSNSKLVMLTHNNLLENAKYVAADLKLKSTDISLLILPMYHASGLIQFLSHLYIGGSVVFNKKIFSPQNFYLSIAEYNITNSWLVPFIVGVLAKKEMLPLQYNIESLRFIGSAGGASASDKVFKLKQIMPNVQFIEGYGLTEASPRISHYFEIQNEINRGCVGNILPNLKCVIRNFDNSICNNGDVGEITINGSSVMKGYFQSPEETAEVLRNDWLYTGDLGKIDSNYRLHIIGRIKNIIIYHGENIYPEEIEEVICSYNGVQEVYVYGKKSSEHGEIPIADIVLNDGFNISEIEIKRFCYKRLSNYKVPKEIYFVKKIAKTSTGKIIRAKAQKED